MSAHWMDAPFINVDAAAQTEDRVKAPSLWRWVAAAGASLAAVVVLLSTQSPAGPRTAVPVGAAPLFLSAAASVPRVKVQLYGMAGCPFTRAFIEGPLQEAMETAPDLIDLDLVTFGNLYYTGEACGGNASGQPFAHGYAGYNATVRQCWENRCGALVKSPPQDCFGGYLVTQHGTAEAMMTTAWACAKRLHDQETFFRFVTCTAHHYIRVTSVAMFDAVVGECADIAGFSGQPILRCAKGGEGECLLQEQAHNTVPHPSVPWAIVNGKNLADTSCITCGDGILWQVCTAWQERGGKDTPVCQAVFGKI